MTEPQLDVPSSNHDESADSATSQELRAGTDSPSVPGTGEGFDDQQTSSYTPPAEQHTSWAPAGWEAQTPSHWFEPMGDPPPQLPQRKSGSSILALFVVGLIAAICGSLITVAALMATDQIGKPIANVVPTASLYLPASTTGAPTEPPAPIGELSIADAAQRVAPSVVTITVGAAQPTDASPAPEEGIGSGIIYDAGGFVLTNRHVVSTASQVSVQLNDGRIVNGTVYGVDTLTDLAIVKIDATDVPAAPIGDSARLEPGQTAIVIGSPLGTFTNSVTSGVVSALGRSLVVTDPGTGAQRRLRNLIQTDAAINPGNSGGPFMNAAGEVVGVSTAYAQGAQGIFFAIPINIAKPIMAQAVAGEPLSRPWFGIVYVAVDQTVAAESKLPIDYGAWISPDTGSGEPPIVSASPAEQAGLKAGDIITSIDGHRIDAGAGLDDVLSLYKPGDTLPIEVLRDGQTVTLSITLGTRPASID